MEHLVQRWVDFDGTHSAFEIREYIRIAKAQLWCMHKDSIKGIWVTRTERTHTCMWGVVWGCAGDFQDHKEDALAFFGAIESWLKDQGCEFVEWIGRDGWARIFPGYEKHAVVLRKRL